MMIYLLLLYMRKWLFISILAIVFPLSVHNASAQSGKWDAALDKYEVICERCIELRTLYAAGESVSATSLASLLSQLATLRESLRNAEGSMSTAQRKRFRQIRDNYLSKTGSDNRQPIDIQSVKSLEQKPRAALPPNPPLALSDRNTCPSIKKKPLPFPADKSPVFGGILFLTIPEPAPGAMLYLTGMKAGGYVKFSSSVRWPKAMYNGTSDGTYPDGYIWTTGKEWHPHWSLTAGGIIKLSSIFPRRAGSISLYAGAGYGVHEILWEDLDGSCARIEDLGAAGFVIDGGLMLSVGRFSLMAGVSTTRFSFPQAEIGAGIRF